MDARCPKCEQVATVDDEMANVKCHHCNFQATYDEYIEIMKDNAVNMAMDYIPDRSGL